MSLIYSAKQIVFPRTAIHTMKSLSKCALLDNNNHET